MTAPNETQWHPIAASSDLPLRHVFQGQLWGRELAVWRADDGNVNVWENRCLHRGVRLSVGLNDGHELKCLYHGWRYANRTAGCTYIPAHPADAPARTICNRTYPGVEAHGLVWSAADPTGEPTLPRELEGATPFLLRPVAVNASVDLVRRHARSYRFSATGESPTQTAFDGDDGHCIRLTAQDGKAHATLLLFLQPLDAGRTMMRGVLAAAPEDETRVLRHHSHQMNALRDMIEADAATRPAPEPIQTAYAPIDAELATLPARSKTGPKTELRVTVARKWQTADDIVAFRLEALRGQLPTFQPGAHLDLLLPNGMSRQYSIINGPGETDHYTIGVKLEPDSRGGSECLHGIVRLGDTLAISAPRNNFPLRRDAVKTLLIAGGIGITPMLAMAQVLKAQGLDFELHCFARSEAHIAFKEILNALGDSVVRHIGLDGAATQSALRELLSGYAFAHHMYVCGPGPMLEAARAIAFEEGWPDAAVHFEYFKNTREIDDSSTFEVALARSALTFKVPAGRSILEVLRDNGIEAPSSCEQGACGTCLATVIEGEPDHQDVYLSEAEKAANNSIVTCVSRAKSKRLVLDI